MSARSSSAVQASLFEGNIAVSSGHKYPLGATWDGEGVNFALFSENASDTELCLFEPSRRREVRRSTEGPMNRSKLFVARRSPGWAK
jgi:glycogen operon protein